LNRERSGKAKAKVESEGRRGNGMEIDGQELMGKKIKENGDRDVYDGEVFIFGVI
jgi:hypothetical protein